MRDTRKLRRQMLLHHLLRGRAPVEGFSSFKQMASLADQALRANALSVAEIGFNAGFSAAAFLSTGAQVVSFDLAEHGVVKAAKRFIDRRYPGRHSLVIGDSRVAVPTYAAENPDARFDVVFIDGCHDYEFAKADLLNMRALCTPETVVIMDDLTPWMEFGKGPSRAWNELIDKGMLLQDQLFLDGKRVDELKPPGWRSWATGRYAFA